ncbi:MAG: hypothetical protein P8N02_05255 [Actinomycetota bacterium]|nr:hypothetical protein [Actinomycetota bacterium]
MNLRSSTVAGICFFLGGLMFFLPIALFDIEYDGIDNDLMTWECDPPITDVSPPDVDLDGIRAQLAELPEGEKLTSNHPECRKLARAQIVLGLIAIAAGIWKTRAWWCETADERAEKKFKKLQSLGSGKSKGLLG